MTRVIDTNFKSPFFNRLMTIWNCKATWRSQPSLFFKPPPFFQIRSHAPAVRPAARDRALAHLQPADHAARRYHQRPQDANRQPARLPRHHPLDAPGNLLRRHAVLLSRPRGIRGHPAHQRRLGAQWRGHEGIIKLRISSHINCVLISVISCLFKSKTIEGKSESEALWSILSFI